MLTVAYDGTGYHGWQRQPDKNSIEDILDQCLTDLTKVIDRHIADKIAYLDPVETANRYAAFLKEKKHCDIVICLTHLGYEGDFFTDPELVSGVRNVDMVIGGHSHTFLENAVYVEDSTGREIPVVTDGNWGIYVGKIEISE